LRSSSALDAMGLKMTLKDHKRAEHSENLTDEEILERLWEASEGVHIEKIKQLAWRGVAIILIPATVFLLALLWWFR